MMRRFVVAVGAVLLVVVACASASAKAPKDPTIIARNIVPSGQYGTPNPSAAGQALMYNALTPLFDQVTPTDLFTDFKSEKLGVDTDGPTTQEAVPFPGVTLLRDRFNVPHVFANTRAAGIQTAGWILAEDRGLLLEQARYNSRVAVIDAPGLSAIGLTAGLQTFKPSAQTEAFTATETKALKGRGEEGKAVLRDIDTYISGINAYLAASHSPNAPWTRNDVYAVNALKGQFLGQGGGDEADRSSFLNGLQQQLGRGRGMAAFNDLRQFKNPRSVTSVNGTFPYGHIPRKTPGSVVIDHNSFTPTPAAPASIARRFGPQRVQASNELMVTGNRSTTGHPILVGGPQISHFFPGLVLEIDMHAPHLHWRGATSAPFPGYLLIGRTPSFSTTLTSASGDIIDQYAETLCGGSNERYLYKGKCRTMGHFRRGHAGRQSGELPDHRARPGRRLREGARAHSRDLIEALEPRQGRARPALLPPALGRLGQGPEGRSSRPRRSPRRPSTPSTSTRSTSPSTRAADCRSATRTSTRAAHQGHRQVRVAGLPPADGAHARQEQQARLHHQLE